MKELDFWHPVLARDELKDKPLAITVAGRQLALFRTADGQIGALEDRCPHRRMRLSKGRVEGNRLVCPYHGWSIDRGGEVRAPIHDNEPMHSCATHYSATELHGAIWVKNAGSEAILPEFHNPENRCAFVLRHRMEGPLEVVLDNFAELDHSITTHLLFGFENVAQATSEASIEEDVLRIFHRGPQKQVSLPLRLIFGIRRGDWVEMPTQMRFAPPHMLSEQRWWNDKAPGKIRTSGIQMSIFFTPVTEQVTDVLSFAFLSPAMARTLKRLPIIGFRLLRGIVDYETRLDQRMLSQLADKSPDLRGMKLARLDKPLGQVRAMVNRVYRGQLQPVRAVESA
ncbi:vanillate O-demethylase monooxygenase subunit [Stigmatella aurantiaca]|uniref:Vanillate O-demethylase monooxygenase subunit n=1 Tax=Stigmatella aurantiaca TaxID=41 RepID=A0A1H7R2F3_STIAU|nr:Rieske 2Fe-2S domain-containing protein [Stigmatella aurantiaca]SEL54158.1 vanillate O-demethylase monooxygenase subunit [Stigmatella aurantiaca]